MAHDIFGIKFGGGSNNNYKAKKIYEISKKQLLDALGIDEALISFISYDYKKGVLTIKEK